MARYLLAGASGLLGTQLTRSLRTDGHEVRLLVRRAPREPDERRWDPSGRQLGVDVLDGIDAVVCLSGAGVGTHRWTPAYKQQILDSRLDSVDSLAAAIAEHDAVPTTLVCASAVGYYGDTGDTVVDEQAAPGDSFLADVCVQWEAAADPAREAGARVAHLRTGLVIARDGDLLGRLVPLTKLGLGGRLGDGRQFMPWISLTDEVAAIRFVLDHDIAGPVNLCGPEPVRNAEFTHTLGSLLHRPTVFAVPGFAAKIALGEFAWNVLTGQRAVPRVLQDAGYEFTHPTLDAALRSELF